MDETILNARYGNVNPFSDKPNMIEQSVSLVKTPEVKQHCIQRDSYHDGPCWNMPDCSRMFICSNGDLLASKLTC
jgi:hypothetical protein